MSLETGPIESLEALHEQLDVMRAENACLAERLRGSPEMRETVRELRQCLRDLDDGLPLHSRRRLERLVIRLDLETTEQTR